MAPRSSNWWNVEHPKGRRSTPRCSVDVEVVVLRQPQCSRKCFIWDFNVVSTLLSSEFWLKYSSQNQRFLSQEEATTVVFNWGTQFPASLHWFSRHEELKVQVLFGRVVGATLNTHPQPLWAWSRDPEHRDLDVNYWKVHEIILTSCF